jgi:hypothetical protein
MALQEDESLAAGGDGEALAAELALFSAAGPAMRPAL